MYKKIFSFLAATVLISSFKNFVEPVKYYGFFKATNTKVYVDTILANNYYQGMAFLLKGGGSNKHFITNTKKSGNVTFNNRLLSYKNFAKTYIDTIGNFENETAVVWKLENSDSLPTIFHTSLAGYPNVQGRIILPNDVKKSSNFTIDLSNVSNFDEIEFRLIENQLNIITPWNKDFGMVNSFTIPASNLTNLSGTKVKLNLILIKKDEQIINGKKFRFENRLSIIKVLNVTN